MVGRLDVPVSAIILLKIRCTSLEDGALSEMGNVNSNPTNFVIGDGGMKDYQHQVVDKVLLPGGMRDINDSEYQDDHNFNVTSQELDWTVQGKMEGLVRGKLVKN